MAVADLESFDKGRSKEHEMYSEHLVTSLYMPDQHRIQDGRRGRGGQRNMKYKAPRMAAIFFMTSFNRDREGGMAPWLPLDPQLLIV